MCCVDCVLGFWCFRDRTFFLAHIVISALLGVFVGGLYWKTNDTIAGFQSRVGSLFFLVRLPIPRHFTFARVFDRLVLFWIGLLDRVFESERAA
jgi:hypothetical protein